MGAGEDTDLTCQMADLVSRAPIATLIFVQNAGAESFFLEVVEGLGNFKRSCGGKLLEDFAFHLVFEGFDCFVAIDLGRLVDRSLDAGPRDAVSNFKEIVFDQEERGLAFLFSAGCGQLFLNLDDGLDSLLGEFEGCLKFGFRKLFGTALDHEGFVFRPDVNEVEVALGVFVMGGVGDKLSCNTADAYGCDGACPRNIGDHECGGGTVKGKNIGIVLAIGAEEDGDDLGIVEVAFGKEGTERTIDHSASENLFFGGAAFSAEVATGDATHGSGFFLILDGEREKVLAVFDFGSRDCGDDDNGFAHSDEGGAVRQFGEFA